MDTLLSHEATGEEPSYTEMAEGGDAAVFKCKYLKEKCCSFVVKLYLFKIIQSRRLTC